MAEDLLIRAALFGAAAVARDARQMADGFEKVGTQVDHAGNKATAAGRHFGGLGRDVETAGKRAHRSSGHFGGLLKTMAGFGLGFGALQGIRSSVDATEALGKQTITYQRVLGGTVKQASELATITTVFGVQGKQATQSFGLLSKNIVAAQSLAGKKQRGMFNLLGVSPELLRSGNTMRIFETLADGFNRLGPGPARTAASMTLLGRSWQTLMPILAQGSKGIEDYRRKADAAGATFDSVAGIRASGKAHREAGIATLGVQKSIGELLQPAITKLLIAWPKLTHNIREGHGAWATLRTVVDGVGNALGFVVGVFKGSTAAGQGLVVTLAALGAGFAIEKVISWTVAIGKSVVVTRALAGAQWLLYVAMAANPIVLAVAGVVALGAALYIAYRKVQWFHDAVDKTFSFVKDHWRWLVLPVAPIVAPISFVVRHWDGLVGFVSAIPGRLAAAGKGMWHWLTVGFANAINWIIGKWDSLHFSVHLGPIKTSIGLPHINPLHVPGTGRVPHMATGGTIISPGLALVGEHGPELLAANRGAKVIPLRDDERLARLAGRLHLNLTSNLVVDKKVIGTATIDDFLRRGLLE